MDGNPWAGIGGAKAKTLAGSDPAWPIGAAAIGSRPAVILCEGGPDFLAAALVAWWESEEGAEAIAPICMTGAACAIHPEALAGMAGKRVRIAIHADLAGRRAANRWATQLFRAHSGSVDGFEFAGLSTNNGRPAKDLADLATTLDDECPPPGVTAGL